MNNAVSFEYIIRNSHILNLPPTVTNICCSNQDFFWRSMHSIYHHLSA